MEKQSKGILAEAVTEYLESDAAKSSLALNVRYLWDGDTYSYSLLRDDEVLLRFYDGTELEKQKMLLERGRKLCMEGDPERYRRIREFARNRFFGVSWDNDLKIGFEFKGQFIIDPWMDQSGRFEQTDEEAVSRYGKDNMALFVITVSDHLALFELYFE